MNITRREGGHVSSTLLALIVVSVLLVGALSFGGWAFASRQDYKNNSDEKAAQAATAAAQAAKEEAEAEFAEEEKSPLASHKAPDQYGSVRVQYPKTWSAYVIENGSSRTPVDDYFHPGAVPDVDEGENTYALRIQVVEESYDKVVKSYDSDVKSNKLAASVYALPEVSSAIGTRFDGQLERDKQGSLVVLPLRNMTIKIWTESSNYTADFNNIILPNLTFAP